MSFEKDLNNDEAKAFSFQPKKVYRVVLESTRRDNEPDILLGLLGVPCKGFLEIRTANTRHVVPLARVLALSLTTEKFQG